MTLSRLSLGYKLGITLFLIGLLLGLLFQHVHMRYSVEMNDGEPGISLDDLRFFFSGDPSKSALQVAIDDSTHRSYADLEERETVGVWLAAGAEREAFEGSVADIILNRCAQCHGPEGARSQSPLATYEGVHRFASATDTGVPYQQLALLSRQVLTTLTCLLALLSVLFYVTRFQGVWKQALIVLPFAGLVINVLSWWSAKQSPTFIHAITGTAVVMFACVTVMAALILADVWILPERREE